MAAAANPLAAKAELATRGTDLRRATMLCDCLVSLVGGL